MFAAVAALAVLAPVLGDAAAVPFLAVAGVALVGIREGELFETLALPGDREDRRLYGLAAFALAGAGLAVFASIPREPLPYGAFAAAMLAVGVGRLGHAAVAERSDDPFPRIAGYLTAGFLAAVLGQILVALSTGVSDLLAILPRILFLAAVAVLTAGLVRSLVYDRDAHITAVVVAFVAWALGLLVPAVSVTGIAVALAVTLGLGGVSYALGAASVPGMLTGVLLSLLTIVLGGVGWFLPLIAFYSVGALATKYRFSEKIDRGVAQENEGARGTGNVLANSAVGLAALIGFAGTPHFGDAAPPALAPATLELLFALAFAGAFATALADTLSSEIGGLYDNPRLITTLKPVPPGTDGAVTWQGEVAGLAGALIIAVLAALGMPLGAAGDPLVGGALVALGGVVGMTADSLLGALIEGDRIGNQAVNCLATLVGALAAVGAGVVVA
ncbi:TIGR00297 family protein [Halorubrum gandharaense]